MGSLWRQSVGGSERIGQLRKRFLPLVSAEMESRIMTGLGRWRTGVSRGTDVSS